jgi:uncharacterized protein YdhG (YjbR/CyaY superfamily)
VDIFVDYLDGIESPERRLRVTEVLEWVCMTYPDLEGRIAWNHPMFAHHGTYIIGFSVAKAHMAVAPENAGIRKFADQIERAGYNHTREIFRIKWTSPVNYELLAKIIDFNVADKADCKTFWRK